MSSEKSVASADKGIIELELFIKRAPALLHDVNSLSLDTIACARILKSVAQAFDSGRLGGHGLHLLID